MGGRALCWLLCLLQAGRAGGAELTFQLPDSARQCFHEPLQRGLKFTLDFQVITGGHYDVDCYVEDPNAVRQLFPSSRSPQASTRFALATSSPLFHTKTVYFDFQVGDEPPILPDMNLMQVCLFPQMESACVTIHQALNTVIDSQTHYRLREAQDRIRAEELNNHVSYWSVGETILVLVVSISQVMLLKSFFTETRATTGAVST
uniref:Transmembrane p24 trafficking protein 3 n=1 Tax=Gopherus evgoodei TaxID=1825980 RepID=A0A8C4W8K9_9SAUR